MITEGIAALDHPGVVFRGPPHDRRAALAGGPDVWEIVARLRGLDGPEEGRIAELTAETALHPRAIRIALDYASHHPEEIGTRLDRQREAADASERAARQRSALLGWSSC